MNAWGNIGSTDRNDRWVWLLILVVILLINHAYGQQASEQTSGQTTIHSDTIQGQTHTTICTAGDLGATCQAEKSESIWSQMKETKRMYQWCKANGHKVNKWNNKGQDECERAWAQHEVER